MINEISFNSILHLHTFENWIDLFVTNPRGKTVSLTNSSYHTTLPLVSSPGPTDSRASCSDSLTVLRKIMLASRWREGDFYFLSCICIILNLKLLTSGWGKNTNKWNANIRIILIMKNRRNTALSNTKSHILYICHVTTARINIQSVKRTILIYFWDRNLTNL